MKKIVSLHVHRSCILKSIHRRKLAKRNKKQENKITKTTHIHPAESTQQHAMNEQNENAAAAVATL
jgi:hypothetical protein